MPDLVNLFRPPAQTAAFAQGVIVAFSPIDGTNQVNVQNQIFTNLPILNSAEAPTYVAGNVVMLAQLGGSYAIMGRVFVPGASGVFGSGFSFGQGSSARVTNFAFAVTQTVPVTSTIAVPAWANTATGISVGQLAISPNVSTQVLSSIGVSTGIASVSGNQGETAVTSGAIAALTCVSSWLLACTPGGTITVSGQIQAGAIIAANTFTVMFLESLIQFSKH